MPCKSIRSVFDLHLPDAIFVDTEPLHRQRVQHLVGQEYALPVCLRWLVQPLDPAQPMRHPLGQCFQLHLPQVRTALKYPVSFRWRFFLKGQQQVGGQDSRTGAGLEDLVLPETGGNLADLHGQAAGKDITQLRRGDKIATRAKFL